MTIEVGVKKCWIKFKPPAPPLVGFQVEKESLDEFREVLGKDLNGYSITLKKRKNKSRDMHNYMWALCDAIARTKHGFSSLTKEDIYRLAVRDAGLWSDVKVPNGSTQALIEDWQRNGVGWFAETVFRGEEETTLRLYRGASVYNAEQLYALTNYVVYMAKEAGVGTITDREMQRLKEAW